MNKSQKDKLVELKQKKAEAEVKKHQELLDSNASITEAVFALNKAINAQQPYDDSKLVEQLKELKESQTFGDDIKRLETALKQSSDKEKLDEIVKAVGNINNADVVKAVNSLIAKIESKAVNQDPEDYQPVRRVRKIGQRLVFDDDPMRVSVAGGVGIPASIIRDGDSIAVVNPDGTPIGGGGGGGDATAANQVTQTGLLEQIRGFDIPPYDEIDLGYTGENLTSVVYSLDSTAVATLTLSYTGDNLTNVAIS